MSFRTWRFQRVSEKSGCGGPTLYTIDVPKKAIHILLAVSLALAVPTGALANKKNSKKDPDAIGERKVGGGMNFYSLEKEIALRSTRPHGSAHDFTHFSRMI